MDLELNTLLRKYNMIAIKDTTLNSKKCKRYAKQKALRNKYKICIERYQNKVRIMS